MSITIKLNREQWTKLAYYPDGYPDVLYPIELRSVVIGNTDAILRSSAETREFIKKKFNGEYNQAIGWGAITFEKEEHVTWFLLNI